MPNDSLDQPYDLMPVSGQPDFGDAAVPKAGAAIPNQPLAQQVAGFPQQAADLGIKALGPLGEAGMTVGDWMRTGQVNPQDIPQVAGGIMLGTMVPEAEEAAPIEAGAEAAAKGITAYHGSPYDFDKFDLSKIGTGEGAQAYGHGLYFAENPEVATRYKAAFNYKPAVVGNDKAAGYLQYFDGDKDKAIEFARRNLANQQQYGTSVDVKAEKAAIQALQNFQPGKMYEVNINADPEHFLDWDKPLSEQSPQIQAAFQQIRKQNLPANSPSWDLAAQLNRLETHLASKGQSADLSTSAIYKSMELAYGHDRAASMLAEAGIPGIKYLDQGSRETGNGTSNYVVFNDNLVNIIRKYGIAGLIGAGAAHFSTRPVLGNPFPDQSSGMATGGQVKATKTQARYRPGTAAKKCELCTMFRAPSSCTAVRGFIARQALCDYFEPKKTEKKGDYNLDKANSESSIHNRAVR